MKAEYRIVRDDYLGYEAQFRPWWCPFWLQCYGVNTNRTLESAERAAQNHAQKVVKSLGWLP